MVYVEYIEPTLRYGKTINLSNLKKKRVGFSVSSLDRC